LPPIPGVQSYISSWHTQAFAECVDHPQHPLTLRTCSVTDFVQDILALVKHPLASRQMAIQIDLRYTGLFEADVEQMTCVFLNIIYNARDAMPDGGTLIISSQCVDGMIHFAFIDTGIGMSSELQAHFLELFVTEGKPNGSGLGMTIVKDILDEHQGHIEVQSVGGKGTTIQIALPRIHVSKATSD
jgi:signal transduction histidine kinase